MSVDTERSQVEIVFELLDQSTTIISENLDIPYIEGLVETGRNLFYNEISMDDLEDKHVEALVKLYEETSLEKMENESIRKGFQLAALKGLKDSVQPHHVMTPDAVALFISYLVNKAVDQHHIKNNLKVLDLGIGSGNLLSAVLNHSDKIDQSFGVEIDDTLLSLTFVSMNLQKHDIQLFKQDALSPLLIDPVDMVVCDLPVGYYPDDIRAKEYQLSMIEGHSFAHHLYIEQSLRHVKDDGLLFFIVPNHLFSHAAEGLHELLKETAYIHGFLQLPLSMFKSEDHAKSILILQKKGEHALPSKETLLAQLPSFKKPDALSKAITTIDMWFKNSYKKHTK
jgi:site-specific DNA-methyltransferase (adenine-specific)